MFYFTKALGNDRLLCLSPLTDRIIQRSGQSIQDTGGYFLFEQCASDEFTGVAIMAHVLSEDAALALKDALGLS